MIIGIEVLVNHSYLKLFKVMKFIQKIDKGGGRKDNNKDGQVSLRLVSLLVPGCQPLH